MNAPASISVEETTTDGAAEHGFGFRLVVSPAPGRVRHMPPIHFHDGAEWVEAGQVMALIEQGSAAVEVVAPADGRVAGVLVRSGEPVLKGQPIVWLDESPLRDRGPKE